MKTAIIILALTAALFAACGTSTKSFITGTYVNKAESEYSIANDTLILEAAEGSTYLIHRRTGFQLITDGRPGKQKHETEEWKAIYDERSKTMTEVSRGKPITFFPESGKLMVGKREYEKLN